MRWTRQVIHPSVRHEHTGGMGIGVVGRESPDAGLKRTTGRGGGEKVAGRLGGARERPGAREGAWAGGTEEEGAGSRARGVEGCGVPTGWARGEGVGEEGGGVSQAMATELMARTGKAGAGGRGPAGPDRRRTPGGEAEAGSVSPAEGDRLNEGSRRGQTFLPNDFLLNLSSEDAGELRTSNTKAKRTPFSRFMEQSWGGRSAVAHLRRWVWNGGANSTQSKSPEGPR